MNGVSIQSKPLAQFRLLVAALLLPALVPMARAQTETVLHNFVLRTGEEPIGGLIVDPSGNLYGTTQLGGSQYDFGLVFQLDKTGKYTVLHVFRGSPADGAYPESGLVRDAAGDLLGTTLGGGAYGLGVVYKIDAAGEYSTLYSFAGGADGSSPTATPALDAAGNLYGTTYYGGVNNAGVVYKLDSSGHYTLLHTFTGGSDGANPSAGVTLNASGNLVGTTNFGGANNGGVVYRVNQNGQEAILHNFFGAPGDGSEPEGGVVIDAAGNLYGTTLSGGAFNLGVVFKLYPSGAETVLHSFAGTPDGASPETTLAFDASGNLYGGTDMGGASNDGSIFKVDHFLQNAKVVFSFSGQNGGPYINGPLLLLNGALYGTTQLGGTGGGAFPDGVIFKVTP